MYIYVKKNTKKMHYQLRGYIFINKYMKHHHSRLDVTTSYSTMTSLPILSYIMTTLPPSPITPSTTFSWHHYSLFYGVTTSLYYDDFYYDVIRPPIMTSLPPSITTSLFPSFMPSLPQVSGTPPMAVLVLQILLCTEREHEGEGGRNLVGGNSIGATSITDSFDVIGEGLVTSQ